MFPEFLSFNIAPYIDTFIKWFKVEYGSLFRTISNIILSGLLKIEMLLIAVPWWVWVSAIVLIIWWQTHRVFYSCVMGALLISIGIFGLWTVAMKTLAIVITAVIISILIGIPIGIAMAESDSFCMVITPFLDAMQTMPSFVYLIPALMLFGLGKTPAVIATVIYALPPIIRLTNLGLRHVPLAVQEAAAAFGATRWQMMREVRIPLAMPSIMAGINQTTMMALSMVVVASMIGAGGLGEKVLIATNHIAVGDGFQAGWAIVALAIVIDRLTQGLVRRLDTSHLQ